MSTNMKASLLVAAISAVGLVSAAQADSYIEQRSFSTSEMPSTTVTRTETINNPVLEERYTEVERPVVIERAPLVEERVRMHGDREKVKIKEYF